LVVVLVDVVAYSIIKLLITKVFVIVIIGVVGIEIVI
jgi:hypothetical protein